MVRCGESHEQVGQLALDPWRTSHVRPLVVPEGGSGSCAAASWSALVRQWSSWSNRVGGEPVLCAAAVCRTSRDRQG